ncbi:NDR1/HIN1-like protein 13 [Brachypodium distachyon]|uniref:Late embryogenesis abundant protein LEA-2 subgroup domain-containing protein n=1 Tax=Brachypodium distachyon TaxID=15368 RepID=A0A0Q3NZK3_BRADI|nr:NDR1/HIN1-like protein 13 [Brachypodium distachyon]KQK23182.1 hypothetical protein BRADI_1g71770v3 [Brachypodium distachyon]|eukprot:XP_014752051.1 NDR1/HIN1-like protein 13 [Brachypodium distachyon]
MAERALPPPYPVAPEPAASSSSAAAFGSPLDPVAAPAVRAGHLKPPPGGTYVVHVQKDQVYRVPPPENAYLAERYRAERASAGKSSCAPSSSSCSPCLLRALGAAAAVALLLAAIVALTIVVLRPDAPSFAVDRFSVRNASSAQRSARVDYDFFLTAVNPNNVTALWYRRGGSARLRHRGTALAEGHVGRAEDGGEDATDFKVLLRGGGQHLPKAVEKGLAGNKGAVALHLAVEIPVQVHVGALGFATRRLAVSCEISAAGLRKDVHISSQNCKSRFGD